MKIVPVEHSRERSPRKPSLDDPTIDFDRDFMLPILGVEMRWWMVAVVHPNNDPKESADFWHGSSRKFVATLVTGSQPTGRRADIPISEFIPLGWQKQQLFFAVRRGECDNGHFGASRLGCFTIDSIRS